MNISICKDRKKCGRAFGCKLSIGKLFSKSVLFSCWNYLSLSKCRCECFFRCKEHFYSVCLEEIKNSGGRIIADKEEIKKMGEAFDVSSKCPFYIEHVLYDINKREGNSGEKHGR